MFYFYFNPTDSEHINEAKKKQTDFEFNKFKFYKSQREENMFTSLTMQFYKFWLNWAFAFFLYIFGKLWKT